MADKKFIDTHTHLFSSEFDSDRNSVLNRAQEVCSALILPNIDWDSIEKMTQLCDAWKDFCFPALGLHPSSVPKESYSILAQFESLIPTRQWIGIGETGLDLYWDKTNLSQQKESLRRHCSWAMELKIPLILHTREAMQETIELIRDNQNGSLTGVFHCFTGTLEEAKEILDMGFYIGIGGVLTYPKSNLREVIQTVDQSRILLETDSPWLPPVPHRGKRNESSMIRHTAEALAQAWFISISEVAEITSQNARRLFFKEEPK